jgi:hypothetical protein
MNMNDVFYPTLFLSSGERQQIVKNPLWALAMAAHYVFEGKLFLIHAEPSVYTMGNADGLPVVKFIGAAGTTYIQTVADPEIGSESSVTLVAESQNDKYLIQRLSKKATKKGRKLTINQLINGKIRETDGLMCRTMTDVPGLFSRQLHPYMAPEMNSLNIRAQEWAMLVAYGKRQMVEVPTDMRLIMDKVFSVYDTRDDRLREFETQAKDFFEMSKWVALYQGAYGVIVGKVNTSRFVNLALTKAKSDMTMEVRPEHIDIQVPFKLYRTFDSINDPSVRREVLASLVLAKSNRDYNVAHRDDEKFIPANAVLQRQIGAISWQYYRASLIMVDA